MERNKRKEPPFKLVNGKKLYNLRFEVTHGLSAINKAAPQSPEQSAMQNQQGDGQTEDAGTEPPAAPVPADPNVLTVRDRVLSAVGTWSGTWYGPQLVDNGARDAFALRKLAGCINSRCQANRAVPMVWDHSLEAKDICGRLTNGAWEDSTDIPPGVNADMELPRSVDARAVQALETGLVNATSIWWQPTSERSHPDMDFGEFLDKQGEIVDGRLVCWMPVDLTDNQVIHHALVWAGADPYSGPREEQSMQNAAQAAPTDTHSEGDRGMEEQLRKMVEALCNGLGINVALGPGSAIPDTLEKRALDGITALRNVQGQYNELAAKVQALSNALLKPGETVLSAADVLNRLPERLEMATHGEAFLKNRQETAVAWLNKAKVDPKKNESLSEVDKRERDRLSNCTDIQLLEDRITMYQNEAKARFGPTMNMRSSQGEDITPPGQPAAQNSADVQIDAQFARWENSYQGVTKK
jgi:hypothetical protein